MATLDANDKAFVHAYSKLLVQAWTDPSYMKMLQANPYEVAKTAGLNPMPNATVTLQDVGGSPDVTEQIKIWRQGDTSSAYTLFVPQQPQLGIQSAGAAVGDTSYCCCCCPCCTCT